jgi:tetratricopeptide (TPR) repeat protein
VCLCPFGGLYPELKQTKIGLSVGKSRGFEWVSRIEVLLGMDVKAAVAWLDQYIGEQTGHRLSELQLTILELVCQGCTYQDIADRYGCTEGHAKDVGSDLWKFLSAQLGERIGKRNVHLALKRHFLDNAGQIAPTLDFVGREEAISQLGVLISQGNKVIVIQGEAGLGKTTLAQHYLRDQGFERVLELIMGKEPHLIVPAEQVVEEWLQRDFQESPSLAFGITLERLKRHLRRQRVGILMDNLEPALDAQGQLLAHQRNYVELLRVLADPLSQSVTLVTSRDRLCEPSLTIPHYRLPGLALAAWQQFFQTQMSIDAPSLIAMHQAYGGNAKAMGILIGAIQSEYGNDMASYWTQHRDLLLAPTDLQNLVNEQLHHLEQQVPSAYRLFCRLGCYRYQDGLAVPFAGVVALLWDLPESERRAALIALRNRSLIEVHRGLYSLHPVLREAALTRLLASPDWPRANTEAAIFWTTSVEAIQTGQDALRALEAYYHYLAIQDDAQAGRVILKSRLNQWQQHLPLGSTLYRMGLLQPLLQAIPTVLRALPQDHTLSELHNILADVYWITGQLQPAIQAQETASQLADVALLHYPDVPDHYKRRHYYRMVGIDSRFSIGLYCLDLWDLERAAICFTEVIDQVTGTAHERWAQKAAVGLALVQSHLGQVQAARQRADALYHTLFGEYPLEKRGSAAFFIQLLAQTYHHLGMGEIAQTLFEKALSFSTSSHYTQVQGRTLTGLAMLQRQRADYSSAIATHQQAIDLLANLGAKCDLAEAHCQRGITEQEMGQSAAGAASLHQAITLFESMHAPLQVAKVQRRLESEPYSLS